jgi:hypothetical protein
MKKSVGLLAVILVLLSAYAYADIINPVTFTVTPEAVKDKILDPAKDNAEFYITIENKGETEDTYKLLLFEDPKWYYQALPNPTDKQLTIAGGGSAKFHLLVKGTNIKNGMHSVRALVQSSNTGNRNYGILRIQVGETPTKAPPAPNFDVDITVPAQMDPKGMYNVLVNIMNKNERLLENVSVKLSSALITDETLVTVNPNETKTVSFAILLEENIKPQQDQLHVTVDYQGKNFYTGDHNFEVVEYVPPFRTEVSVDKKFLRQDRTITITNDGNVRKEDAVRIQTSLKEKFFSSSEPKFTTAKEDGKYYLIWQAALEPQESTTIKLTTSYRILILLVLVIIAYLAYRIAMSNPLIVRKKIVALRKHGGAIADFGVMIYLRNRGKEPLKNIRVIDRVTRMVQLKNDSFEGSMHPVKMHTHASEGTLLEYRFSEIAPGDERIIKYKVYSKLHIFGNLALKPTVVEFIKKNGATRKSKSNLFTIATEEQKKQQVPSVYHRKRG